MVFKALACPSFSDTFDNSTCFHRPKTIAADADIGGIGVYWSFIIAASLSLVVSIGILFLDWISPRIQAEHSFCHEFREASRAFLLALSDTQLITSLSLLITLEAKKCDGMVVYHYNMVNEYILISTVTHAFSLLMLAQWFRIRPYMAVFRGLIIIAIYLWATVDAFYGQYMAAGNDPDVAYPAACYLSSVHADMPGKSHHNSIGIVLLCFTVVAITAPLALFSSSRSWFDNYWYLGEKYRSISVGWLVRISLQAATPLIAFCWGIIVVNQGRNAITPNSSPVSLDSNSQNEWTFGQILPMALVGLVTLFAIEQWPETEERRKRILARGEIDGFFPLRPERIVGSERSEEYEHIVGKDFRVGAEML